MYSQEDLVVAKAQLKKFLILIIGVFVLFLTAAIIAKQSNDTIGMLIIVVGVSIDIFIWGMFTAPVLAYYRYIKDIMTGRSRTITGVVKNITSEPIYKDNKLFYYEVLIEEEGIERVLLLDNHKEWPKITTDKTYEFQIFENYVLNIKETAA